jgi:colanic acid/amylovoran biosynthesis glycosyltransferase
LTTMPTVAYIANQFPSPLEGYVKDEICELRRRGLDAISCSVLRPPRNLDLKLQLVAVNTLCLFPLRAGTSLHASWLCIRRFSTLKNFFRRVLLRGKEPLSQRIRALAHIWLGAYYALLLRDRQVDHIHVHHGYFAASVAMVAARLLQVDFSMTLHGSDVLLHAAYLDAKLANCKFCLTVSEFNRQYILQRYPHTAPEKIVLQRLGVDVPPLPRVPSQPPPENDPFLLLAVGRLHPVKDHAFLLRACALLSSRGVRVLCHFAGEGPERPALQKLISNLGLEGNVRLLGHLGPAELEAQYAICDLVVLTSRSEGIPLVLMEAMARGKPVLAPAITGIPELVVHGKTGFLYRSGSIEDFARQLALIRGGRASLPLLRQAAHQHVRTHFNKQHNLENFCDMFLSQITLPEKKCA